MSQSLSPELPLLARKSLTGVVSEKSGELRHAGIISRTLRSSASWHRFGLVLAALYLFFLILSAGEPHWLATADPLEANARAAFRAPGSGHLLGTDENGRDVWARVVYASRSSLLLGLGATTIALSLGIGLGLAAGLGSRLVDGFFMRLIDLILALPDVLLALVIITFWGQGMVNVMLAIGIASVPRYARLVRAQTHVIRRAPFVEAARTLGLRSSIVIWRHVLPNAIKPVILLATIGFGEKIAFGAALSFLGFGTPPPAPEWGSMLSAARNFLTNAWWLTAFPAAAITLTVIAVTVLGRELMRRSEGKQS